MSDDVQEMSTSVRWFLDALATAAAPFGLSSAVIVLQSVWEHVGLCKVNKAQLTLLAHSSCVATDGLVKARRHDVADESVMTDFDRLLRKVETFVVKQSSTHLLKTVLRAKDTELQIAQLHDQIQHHMAAFGVRPVFDFRGRRGADRAERRCRPRSPPPRNVSGSPTARRPTCKRSRPCSRP